MLKIIQQKRQRYVLLFTVIYFCISISFVEFLTGLFIQNQVKAEKEEIRYQIALIRSRIEATIYRDTYLAESVSTLVTIAPDFAVKNWRSIAQQLTSKAYYVRNISLYPNDVITHVYPEQGNQQALGLDLRTVPGQYHTVLRARRYQSVFLSPPVDLVQGGQGIIVRYPIFSDFPYKQDYWGGVSVVLDYEKLLRQSGVYSVKGAKLAIVQNVHGEQKASVIMGDPLTVQNSDISFPIHLPSGTWKIYAAFADISNTNYELTLILRLVGALGFLVIYVLLFLVYRSYQSIRDVSLQDELTLLPNRRFMIEMIDKLMSQSSAAGSAPCFAILNIDLNKFKEINDTFGHLAGDDMLKHVAHIFTENLRSSDIVCRFGGDEFVILLHRVSTPEEVDLVVSKLRKAIDDTVLIWDGHEIYPSVSIGYALYDQNKDTCVDDILARADKNMYQEKESMMGNLTTQ